MFEIQRRYKRDEAGTGEESVCGLTHAAYRGAILKRALRSGPNPGAKTMFKAKRAVDLAVERAGFSVEIPGARPGRRTI